MRTRLIPAALAAAVVLTGCQTDDPQPRSAPAEVTPLQAPGPGRILDSRMLTGPEIKAADKSRNWGTAPGDPQTPFCGILSTRRPESRGLRMASFMTEYAELAGQWVTEYDDPAAATSAYKKVIGAIRLCQPMRGVPGPKLVEDRPMPQARVLRWSDPRPEGASHSYAVTRVGNLISVTVLRVPAPGMSAPGVEQIARTAASRLAT